MLNRKENRNSGFIGLLGILIATAIIIFMATRSLGLKNQEKKTNSLPQGIEAIEQAQNIKNTLEAKDRANINYIQ